MDKTFDPLHLDLQAFAQAGAELHGEGPLANWPRLWAEQWAAEGAAEGALSGPVHWQLQGRMTPVMGGAAQVGMALQAEVDMALQCQRCLTPVVQKVRAEREFLFVADEATAEALDEDSEADVLVISRDFDALSLVEDELILALPLVPRHEVCPESLPRTMADLQAEAPAEHPHPFAALAVLKKGA